MVYKKINPFLLHNKMDKNQRSWLYVESKNSEDLRRIFNNLFDRKLFNDMSRWSLLRWRTGVTGIPLWALQKVYKKSKDKKLKKEILDNIDYIYSPGGQKLYLPTFVDEEMGLILGIHAGDGSIPRNRHSWRVSDRDENSLRWLKNLVEKKFKIKADLKQRSENKWELIIESKPFSRFLHQICGVPRGYKSKIITEPNIVERSPLNVRKMFVNGVIGSDGSVRIDKKNQKRITIEVRSSKLIYDISRILKKCKIRHSTGNRFMKSQWGEGILYSLYISGNIQCNKFLRDIGIWHLKKLQRLAT